MQVRKRKLIRPRLQLLLIGVFLGTAGLAIQVEAILISLTLTGLAGKMPNDGGLLISEIPEFVRTNLLLTFGLLVPLTVIVGIAATFKIAGPLYRFEQFLRAVRDGSQVEPCKLRKGDELQDFCELLNEVTAPLRNRPTSGTERFQSQEPHSLSPALPSARSVEVATAATTGTSSQRRAS